MIHIYTGEGKGKTTAAVGLATRASKHFKVLFVQLVKDGKSSEVAVLKNNPKIVFKAFGEGKRVYPEKTNLKEKTDSRKAMDFLRQKCDGFDVIVIDEGITAVSLGLLPEKELLDALKIMPQKKEVIVTGRGASKKICHLADLVTEMKKIKHYYDIGVQARKGIEY